MPPTSNREAEAASSGQAAKSSVRVSNPEWAFLVQAVSSHAQSESLADAPLDWPKLLRLAEQHGVRSSLASHARSQSRYLVPQSTLSELNESARGNAAFTLQLSAELFRIIDAFRARSVDLLVTKGPALSVRCYGDPAVRQYSDLDLIVRDKDIQRASDAMIELGYEPKIPLSAIAAGKTPGEYNFTKPGTPVLIEFHTERTFRYHPHPLPIEKVFARSSSVAIDGRAVPTLSLEDDLILICVHGAKHFWERLLWIADVAALISRDPGLDWDRVRAAAGEVRAERILRLGLCLAHDLLHAPMPEQLRAGIESDRTIRQLAARILERLPALDPEPLSLLQRAAFRVRMRGNFAEGLLYLLRLSLSPTEEDWAADQSTRSSVVDAALRPARLLRKHRLPRA